MPDYPLPKFHFRVEWGGAKMAFIEVSGLDVETEVTEYREGNSPEFFKTKMPGMQKYGNITLKRGTFKAENSFREWYNTIAFNKVTRRDVTITLLNENHESKVVWNVMNAWPVKVQSIDLKADGNEVAIESREIAYEGFTIEFI